jgi:hypothetical protein
MSKNISQFILPASTDTPALSLWYFLPQKLPQGTAGKGILRKKGGLYGPLHVFESSFFDKII